MSCSLYDALADYLRAAIDIRAPAKPRHDINRWLRLGGAIDIGGVTTERIIAVRREGVSRNLSPRTIEDTISTILTIVRAARRPVPAPNSTAPCSS